MAAGGGDCGVQATATKNKPRTTRRFIPCSNVELPSTGTLRIPGSAEAIVRLLAVDGNGFVDNGGERTGAGMGCRPASRPSIRAIKASADPTALARMCGKL